MPTEYGVEYNLAKSEYKYFWDVYEFRFSSATHLKRFEEQLEAKIEWMSDSMSRRFHFTVCADVLAAFQLYLKVETRGCWVMDFSRGEVATCPENITLAGMRTSLRG